MNWSDYPYYDTNNKDKEFKELSKKVTSEAEDIVTKSLKDCYHIIPDLKSENFYHDFCDLCNITVYPSYADAKIFPVSYIRKNLKEAFPDYKISIKKYSHPYFTHGDIQYIIRIFNK